MMLFSPAIPELPRPHIVFVMADDMGWGQTGYRNHPVLQTPNLDATAAGGLRFEREIPAYAPYLPQWKDRWEFNSYLERRSKTK